MNMQKNQTDRQRHTDSLMIGIVIAREYWTKRKRENEGERGTKRDKEGEQKQK